MVVSLLVKDCDLLDPAQRFIPLQFYDDRYESKIAVSRFKRVARQLSTQTPNPQQGFLIRQLSGHVQVNIQGFIGFPSCATHGLTETAEFLSSCGTLPDNILNRLSKEARSLFAPLSQIFRGCLYGGVGGQKRLQAGKIISTSSATAL